jgi:hypothetical protein
MFNGTSLHFLSPDLDFEINNLELKIKYLMIEPRFNKENILQTLHRLGV